MLCLSIYLFIIVFLFLFLSCGVVQWCSIHVIVHWRTEMFSETQLRGVRDYFMRVREGLGIRLGLELGIRLGARNKDKELVVRLGIRLGARDKVRAKGSRARDNGDTHALALALP